MLRQIGAICPTINLPFRVGQHTVKMYMDRFNKVGLLCSL